MTLINLVCNNYKNESLSSNQDGNNLLSNVNNMRNGINKQIGRSTNKRLFLNYAKKFNKNN